MVLHIDRPEAAVVGDDEQVGLADPLAHVIRRKPSTHDHRDATFHGLFGQGLQLRTCFRGGDDHASRNLFEAFDGRPFELSALIKAPLQLRRHRKRRARPEHVVLGPNRALLGDIAPLGGNR